MRDNLALPLRWDFLPDYGMTASSFAAALGVSRQTVIVLSPSQW